MISTKTFVADSIYYTVVSSKQKQICCSQEQVNDFYPQPLSPSSSCHGDWGIFSSISSVILDLLQDFSFICVGAPLKVLADIVMFWLQTSNIPKSSQLCPPVL